MRDESVSVKAWWSGSFSKIVTDRTCNIVDNGVLIARLIII